MCFESFGNGSSVLPDVTEKIFVNRSLNLENIKFYGFDMDYTLAEYKSCQYEKLGFELTKQRLISLGYPKEILAFEYDSNFPVRGMWFDTLFGNLLKVDDHGSIRLCVHGVECLKESEIRELYPNKFIKLDESRIYVMNTLFNLPETYLLACLIDYFKSSPQFTIESTGVKKDDLTMSYKTIFRDVRGSVDWIHHCGDLKKRTMENLELYVQKDHRLPIVIDRIRQSGAKVFLLTNSEYYYTEKIMSYLLEFPYESTSEEQHRSWQSYFDVVVVNARKPLFFGEGTLLRQVDIKTGDLKLGAYKGPLKTGQVYSGGSCEIFTRLIGAKGEDVLYVGDHIYGDILKSKKACGWRTFLIVPEVVQELRVWSKEKTYFEMLRNLENLLNEMNKSLDSNGNKQSDVFSIMSSIKSITREMDRSYGKLGSLFRSGNRQTFFSSQLVRYADLYSASFLNLIHYPFSFIFTAFPTLLPHESVIKSD